MTEQDTANELKVSPSSSAFDPVDMNHLAERLGGELRLLPEAATALSAVLRHTPLHQMSLCLVRNPKRVLANHRKEYDTLVRYLAWGGRPPTSRALSPTSPPTTPSASSDTSSGSMGHRSGESISSSSSVSSILSEDLVDAPYKCQEAGGVRYIRFATLGRMMETRQQLRQTFPRAFFVGDLLRESLRSGHGRSIVPVADAWLVSRTGVDAFEIIRADWYFQA
ncbi:MAG: hypothetical protein DHS80DRAFT_28756 [Piptocephalis tieghemiana]|nr:MAG: hypothetical protein DHS80DRAFT_28756 [Piptocephalis tieghemiana]